MKRYFNHLSIFIILLLAFVPILSYSQTVMSWGRQFGTDKEEYVHNHLVDREGNCYVPGNTRGVMDGQNFGKTDGFLAKTDSAGNLLWTKQFGSAEDEDVKWSAMDPQGNIYITGSTTGVLEGKSHGKEDIFLVKYTPQGQKLWIKQFGSDSSDIVNGMFITSGGTVYLTGFTTGVLGKSSKGQQDAFIMVLTRDGHMMSTIQFGTPAYDAGAAITADNHGNVFVCGSTAGSLTTPNTGLLDVFTAHFTTKLSVTPILVRFTQFGSEGFDIPASILIENTRNIYIGGTTSGNLGGRQLGEGDCFLTKMTFEGEILWKRQFGTSKHDGIKGMAFNPLISDHILVSGLLGLPPAHAFIRMYKKDGSLLWEKNLVPEGDSRDASGKDVSLDNQGYIYQVGLTASNLFGKLQGVTDFYILKLRLDKEFRIK